MKRFMLIVLLTTALAAMAQTDVNKVPDQYAARMWKLRYDQQGLQNQMLQLQQQYMNLQQQIAHDETEIAGVKKEALDAAKKDDTWDIDLAKMEFIAKPKPAPAPPAKK